MKEDDQRSTLTIEIKKGCITGTIRKGSLIEGNTEEVKVIGTFSKSEYLFSVPLILGMKYEIKLADWEKE